MANPQVRARIEAAVDDEGGAPVSHPYFRPPRPTIPVRRSDPDQGLVLAIYSPKGGTGCSTLAANLAVCLSQAGVSVALVDGHRSFGSVDVLLQLDPKGPSVMSFVDEPDIQPTHVLEALTPHASGVRSLLAPLQPEQGERVTSEIYLQVLNQLCRHFICTIVDLPVDYDPCTMSIVQRADRLLVPTGPDLPALKAIDRFLAYADDLPGVRERVDLVLIRADSVPADQVTYLEERLGQQFAHRVISDGRRTTQAANRGAPFVLSAPDAPVSKDIRYIAQWLTHTYLAPRARILWMAQEARLGGKR
jgi:pilus assembly protein CpaE